MQTPSSSLSLMLNITTISVDSVVARALVVVGGVVVVGGLVVVHICARSCSCCCY